MENLKWKMENGKKENALVSKSEYLAVRIVNLYKHLSNSKKESILSKQLLRSGTSIGANVAEAQEAQSTADFIAKLYISLKECRESKYWAKLLFRTDYLTEPEFNSLIKDLNEIYAILITVIKRSKSKQEKDVENG